MRLRLVVIALLAHISPKQDEVHAISVLLDNSQMTRSPVQTVLLERTPLEMDYLIANLVLWVMFPHRRDKVYVQFVFQGLIHLICCHALIALQELILRQMVHHLAQRVHSATFLLFLDKALVRHAQLEHTHSETQRFAQIVRLDSMLH
jgi:hypothetical protein